MTVLDHLRRSYRQGRHPVVLVRGSQNRKDGIGEGLGQLRIIEQDQAAIRQVRYSFDLLLYSSHRTSDWTSLVNSVKTNGRMAIIGFPDDPVTFDPFELVVHQMSITGSFLGNRIAMREMLSFAQAHSIRPAVELMPMSRANDAIRRVRENQARYRIVLVNDMDNG